MEKPIDLINHETLDASVTDIDNLDIVRKAVERMTDGGKVVEFLTAYVEFSRTFDGAVALLVGRIKIFQCMADIQRMVFHFGLGADPMDHAAENIFLAVRDEFGGNKAGEVPHRLLSQATLLGTASYFGATPPSGITTHMASTKTGILAGYGHERPLTKENLMREIGFHLASEFLAQHEFNILYEFFQQRYSDLLKALREKKVQIEGYDIDPSLWLEIHKGDNGVEVQHRDAAIKAANFTLEKFSDGHSYFSRYILGGFGTMCNVQAEFFRHILLDL